MGCVCGGFIGGAISERIGKKVVVAVANLVVMTIWIGMSFSTSSWLIISIRFLSGIFCTAAYNCIRESIETDNSDEEKTTPLPFQL